MAARKSVAVETVTPTGETAVVSTGGGPDMKMAHLLPWAMWLAAPAVAEANHLVFGASPSYGAWSAAGDAVCAIAMTGVTWRYSSKRSPVMRAHSTATAALTGVWITATGIAGVLEPVTAWMWGFAGAALAATWNIKHMLRNTGREAGVDGGAANRSLLASIGHAKALIRKTEVGPNRVAVEIQAAPGQEASDLVASRGQMAAALALPGTAVRATVDPGHNGVAHYTFTPVDVLRSSPRFPGPSAPGGTMVDALRMGLYEDGEDLLIYGAADPEAGRNQEHLMEGGMTGSGKGIAGRAMLAEIGTRREVSVFLIDTVKERQTFGCADDGGVLDWFITDKNEAYELIKVLPAIIKARTNYLAGKGLDNWVPGCGLSFLVVWIEEMPSVVRDSKTMVDAAAAARSGGVWFVGSLQRPTFDNMPTSLRNSFGQTLCFGVKDTDEAAIIMPDATLRAGANPAEWQARKPGYCYLVSGGTSEERHVVPARSFGAPFSEDPGALTELLLEHAHLRTPLDPVTAAAAGPAYASRKVNPHPARWAQSRAGRRVPAGVPSARRPELAATPAEVAVSEPVYDAVVEVASPAAPRALPAPAGAGHVQDALPDAWSVLDEDEHDDEELLAQLSEEELAELALPAFVSEEPDVAAYAMAAADQDLPVPAADFAFGPTPGHTTKEEAEAFVLDVLRAMAETGRTRFETKEMVKIAEKTGKSPGWIRTFVSQLEKRDVLKRVATGVYEIVKVPEAV